MELTLTAPRNDRSRAYSLHSRRSIGQTGGPWSGRDEQRTVTKRNSYASFGESFAPTLIDGTGYTGHVMDQATGLTYMQQRYYDPQSGRFLSVDPIAANTGSGFNRYSYANNNPYRFTDPDGRMSADEAKYKSEQARQRRERHESNERAKHSGWGPATGASRAGAAAAAPKGGIGAGYSVPGRGAVTPKEVTQVTSAVATGVSAVNLGIESLGTEFDKMTAKGFGSGLARFGAITAVVEVYQADSASEVGHGMAMGGLLVLDGTPLAPAAVAIQCLDVALQAAPAYKSKYDYGSANGWSGLGLMGLDAVSTPVPYHPMEVR